MKVLCIASVADKRNRLDGETVKNRVLKDYLLDQKDIELKTVDTDNFRKKPVMIAVKILRLLPWCDKIVLSCSDQGAHIVLSFLRRIHFGKEIFYFVIGGRLANRIKENAWSTKDYVGLNKIYVESEILKDLLKEMGLDNVSVVRNFRKIKDFVFATKEDDKVVHFVFYGRVIREKGVENAIALIKDLNAKGIVCELDIFGQGDKSYLEYLKSLSDEKIKFMGEIKPNGKREFEILSSYDVFLFPTEYPGECLPGSLIDARIAGLAVLASNWKYAKEFIDDGRDGFIFEYANYDDMRKKAIKMLYNKQYKKMKSASRKRAKEFDYKLVLAEPLAEIRGVK